MQQIMGCPVSQVQEPFPEGIEAYLLSEAVVGKAGQDSDIIWREAGRRAADCSSACAGWLRYYDHLPAHGAIKTCCSMHSMQSA